MSNGNHDEANNLQLSIHGVLIGYLAGFKDGRNILGIGGSIKKDPTRPTYSLITLIALVNGKKLVAGIGRHT